MTDKYQPCDTHINGALKGKLMCFWSENKSPVHQVSLADTVKETTKILGNFSQQFIQRAFTESIFTPANTPRAVVHPPHIPNYNPELIANNPALALAYVDNIMSRFDASSRQYGLVA